MGRKLVYTIAQRLKGKRNREGRGWGVRGNPYDLQAKQALLRCVVENGSGKSRLLLFFFFLPGLQRTAVTPSPSRHSVGTRCACVGFQKREDVFGKGGGGDFCSRLP